MFCNSVCRFCVCVVLHNFFSVMLSQSVWLLYRWHTAVIVLITIQDILCRVCLQYVASQCDNIVQHIQIHKCFFFVRLLRDTVTISVVYCISWWDIVNVTKPVLLWYHPRYCQYYSVGQLLLTSPIHLPALVTV